jgi:hypothetical protein
MEARIALSLRSEPLQPFDLLSSHPDVRRSALKRLAYTMPMRPLMVFFYLYVLRMGLLDGRGGFYFSRMRAAYETMIDLKINELERRREGLQA